MIAIRLLDDPSDLVRSFRLRHDVFAELGYLQHQSVDGLEVDEFDQRSVHFGAEDEFTGRLVGTLRRITAQNAARACLLRVLARSRDPGLRRRALQAPARPMPSILDDDIARRLEAYNVRRQPVEELSRAVVHPAYRGRHVWRALMEAGIEHATQAGPALLVGGCLDEHVPMYARFGYERLPGTGTAFNDTVGRMAATVVCDTAAKEAQTWRPNP